MHSRIWFELSDQGATLPHVTRKIVQNTRPSFSHVQGGAGHEISLVPLANFPVCAESACYAKIICLTWSCGSQLLLTRIAKQILLRRDYRRNLWGKSSSLASVTTLHVSEIRGLWRVSSPFSNFLGGAWGRGYFTMASLYDHVIT